MIHRRTGGAPAGLVAVLVLALEASACGSATTIREAPANPPLTTAHIDVRQTGAADATIAPGSVAFQVDGAGLLVMTAQLVSRAATTTTVTARASLYDGAGRLVGDAQGSVVSLAPGATTPLQLNGPAPHGTVAAASVELTSTPTTGTSGA